MPKKENSLIAWGEAKKSKRVIIEAATRCFEKGGYQQTSMNEIAEAAGISRKTLYRVFKDRSRLMKAVLILRWAKVSEYVELKINEATCLEEALIEGSVAVIKGAYNDKLIKEIMIDETDFSLLLFLLRNNERIYETGLSIWQSAIKKGRQQGVVKNNLSDDRIIEIIANIHGILLMLNEDPAKQRAFLQDVLIPAITTVKN